MPEKQNTHAFGFAKKQKKNASENDVFRFFFQQCFGRKTVKAITFYEP